jgi:hypothetical protein
LNTRVKLKSAQRLEVGQFSVGANIPVNSLFCDSAKTGSLPQLIDLTGEEGASAAG